MYAPPPLALIAALLLAPQAAAPRPQAPPPAAPGALPTPAQVQASQVEARRLSDAFVAVAEKVSPSVVQIDVTSRDDSVDHMLRWFGQAGPDSPVARGMGSGVVLTNDGMILTNNHVVDQALTINVHLRDGRFVPARLVGRDPATDLAVIKIDAVQVGAAQFADSDTAKVGQWVVAIGSPFGLGYSVTAGVLSATGRGGLGMNAIEDYLQTDASINPGNSGGPLCDLDGRVVGINTMIVGRASGIGFAVPSNMARRVAEQIVKRGKVERAWIGVGFQDLTPELAAALKVDARAGVLVNSVVEGAPAFKANVRAGDLIAAVAGHPVRDGRELIREILNHDVGQTVALEILRDGRRYATSVALVVKPGQEVAPAPVQQAATPREGLGLTVRDLSPAQASSIGLPAKPLPIIATIVPGSAADRAGLRAGDVIVEVDGVNEPTSAQVQQAAVDGALLVRVRRKDSAFYAALRK